MALVLLPLLIYLYIPLAPHGRPTPLSGSAPAQTLQLYSPTLGGFIEQISGQVFGSSLGASEDLVERLASATRLFIPEMPGWAGIGLGLIGLIGLAMALAPSAGADGAHLSGRCRLQPALCHRGHLRLLHPGVLDLAALGSPGCGRARHAAEPGRQPAGDGTSANGRPAPSVPAGLGPAHLVVGPALRLARPERRQPGSRPGRRS